MARLTPEQYADLTAQLRELKEARRSGVKRIQFNERDVTYKTDAEMKDAIEDLEKEIAEGIAPRRRSGIVLASFNAGFHRRRY